MKNHFTKITKASFSAITLVETLVSMTILSVIMLLALQSFNSILYSTVMVDARTSVRNEGEFVNEFFKVYVQNAEPSSVSCNTNAGQEKVTWYPRGGTEMYQFAYQDTGGIGRFELRVTYDDGSNLDTVLTYNDVNVHSVNFYCVTANDEGTGTTSKTLTLSYRLDSTTKLGSRAAVENVQHTTTISLR